MMEHRLGRRVAIGIPVHIDFQDGTSGWGLATDIGRGGLHVRTVVRPLRDRNGCVDLHMTLALPGGQRTVLLPAAVVHRGPRGFGVMFRGLDQGAEEAVAWLLETHDPAARFPSTTVRSVPIPIPGYARAAGTRRRAGGAA
jgi:hypothetical protein